MSKNNKVKKQKVLSKKENSDKEFGIKNGFLLAILPFVGYLAAYRYEEGYLSFFGVPSFLIKLSLEEVVVAITAVLIGLFGLYFFFSILYPFRNLFLGKGPVRFTIYKSVIIFFLLFYPFVFIFNASSFLDKLINSFFAFSLILLWQFGVPYFFEKGDSLGEKITKSDKERDGVGSIEDYISSKPQLKSYYVVFLAILLISYFAHSAGNRDASNQKDFTLFSNDRTYAIIRNYADEKIAVEINKESLHVENNMLLVTNNDKLELSIENIGPLNREKRRSISVSLSNYLENITDEISSFVKDVVSSIKKVIPKRKKQNKPVESKTGTSAQKIHP